MSIPNMLDYSMYFKMPTHYRLDDGRFWDISAAKFVNSISDGDIAVECVDNQRNSTVDGLIACLEQYGFPKGELKSDEEYASEARLKRNQLLAETDYYILEDYPLSNQRKEEIKAYRQLLRDISNQPGFPRQIDWPVKPE